MTTSYCVKRLVGRGGFEPGGRRQIPTGQATRFSMGLTAIRSPVAANTAFRLRSSGLPDLESILYVASRVSFALRAISAIPPCAWATWRSASMSAAWSPSSITASRYAAASAGSLSCLLRPLVSFAHRLDVAQVADHDSREPRFNARARLPVVQALQPLDERLFAAGSLVVAKLRAKWNL